MRCRGSEVLILFRSPSWSTARSARARCRNGWTKIRTRAPSWSTWWRRQACRGMGWFTCVEGVGADDRPVSVIHADRPDLRMLAVFDVLINNADRKGGHILGSSGRVFGVDHGVSFHTDSKLRTLLWGWAGAEVTDAGTGRRGTGARLGAGRAAAACSVMPKSRPSCVGPDQLLQRRRLPRPRGAWPSIPWPPF